MLSRLLSLTAALIVAAATVCAPSVAAERMTFVRDAEIENTIRTYATPLFAAAGMSPDAIDVHIVNDKSINAFVAGGTNLFLNTGLLLAAENPNQVIGVIAHETGHIAGGHLARTHDALRGASVATILSAVLGAAAVVAGSTEGAIAIIAGGQTVAQQSFLRYSRTQEQAADQFAVSTLDRTGQSARGLMEFLETLEDQEVLASARQDPYLRTHPLARDRIDFVRNHVANSPYSDAESPPEYVDMFNRMRGKLYGFLRPPRDTLQRYSDSDASLEARYARAIAYYRRPDLDKALPAIDALIADHPGDGYFHELKGQVLFENGRTEGAIAAYRRAVELLPEAALIRVGLAQALIETGDPARFAEATDHLEAAVRREPHDAKAWRLLSVVYGRNKEFGKSALASAEYALLTGRHRDAVGFAQKAGDMLPYGSPGQLRAQDIEQTAQNAIKKKNN